MARKGWAQLSADYRKRLEKGGITKTKYEAGESIRAARGHLNTPERPRQAKNFPSYQAEQDRLINKIVTKRWAWFSNSSKWNPDKEAARYKSNPPSLKLLRMWANFTKEEWLRAIRRFQPEEIRYLGYH